MVSKIFPSQMASTRLELTPRRSRYGRVHRKAALHNPEVAGKCPKGYRVLPPAIKSAFFRRFFPFISGVYRTGAYDILVSGSGFVLTLHEKLVFLRTIDRGTHLMFRRKGIEFLVGVFIFKRTNLIFLFHFTYELCYSN